MGELKNDLGMREVGKQTSVDLNNNDSTCKLLTAVELARICTLASKTLLTLSSVGFEPDAKDPTKLARCEGRELCLIALVFVLVVSRAPDKLITSWAQNPCQDEIRNKLKSVVQDSLIPALKKAEAWSEKLLARELNSS